MNLWLSINFTNLINCIGIKLTWSLKQQQQQKIYVLETNNYVVLN